MAGPGWFKFIGDRKHPREDPDAITFNEPTVLDVDGIETATVKEYRFERDGDAVLVESARLANKLRLNRHFVLCQGPTPGNPLRARRSETEAETELRILTAERSAIDTELATLKAKLAEFDAAKATTKTAEDAPKAKGAAGVTNGNIHTGTAHRASLAESRGPGGG